MMITLKKNITKTDYLFFYRGVVSAVKKKKIIGKERKIMKN